MANLIVRNVDERIVRALKLEIGIDVGSPRTVSKRIGEERALFLMTRSNCRPGASDSDAQERLVLLQSLEASRILCL